MGVLGGSGDCFLTAIGGADLELTSAVLTVGSRYVVSLRAYWSFYQPLTSVGNICSFEDHVCERAHFRHISHTLRCLLADVAWVRKVRCLEHAAHGNHSGKGLNQKRKENQLFRNLVSV